MYQYRLFLLPSMLDVVAVGFSAALITFCLGSWARGLSMHWSTATLLLLLLRVFCPGKAIASHAGQSRLQPAECACARAPL